MSRTPFVFTLEPERIAVRADRDEVEARLQRARAALEDARSERSREAERLRASVQQRVEHLEEETRHASYSAADWAARTEYLAVLVERRRQAEERVRAADGRVRAAAHVHANLESRLAELELSLRALGEECDRQERAWRKEAERRADDRRNEEALLRWSHEQEHRRREEHREQR